MALTGSTSVDLVSHVRVPPVTSTQSSVSAPRRTGPAAAGAASANDVTSIRPPVSSCLFMGIPHPLVCKTKHAGDAMTNETETLSSRRGKQALGGHGTGLGV